MKMDPYFREYPVKGTIIHEATSETERDQKGFHYMIKIVC
jgi:hypothetical protein